jgi:hypothetical protein
MRHNPGKSVGRQDIYSPTRGTIAAGGYHINSKFTSDQNYKILQYMCDTCGNMTVCDTCGDGNSMSEMSHITPKFLVLLLKMYNRLL